MIRYLKHSEINLERWDECVSSAHNQIIYGLSWYLNVICTDSWDALVLNDYDAVMPLPTKKKYFIQYIYPPFFAQQLGVFSKEELNAELVQRFIKRIPSKFLYAELVLNEYCSSKLSKTIPAASNTNIVMDLNMPLAVLQQQYGYNLRRNLKKIESEDIALTDTIEFDSIETLFRQARGAEFPNMKEEHYTILRSLVREALMREYCFMVGVQNKEGKNIAGAVFMIFQNRMMFLFSGQSEEGRSKKALFFLLDQVIQKYAGTPMILDFEGGNDEDLARFYKGFGGVETFYSKIIRNKLSWIFKKN